VTEEIDSYAITISFRRGKPIISEVVHAKTTQLLDRKTRALQTSRSEAKILDATAGQVIADKLGIAYQEPRRSYRLNLSGKLRLQGGFNQKPRSSRAINRHELQRLADQLNLRLAK
jgi:hypothetical protein